MPRRKLDHEDYINIDDNQTSLFDRMMEDFADQLHEDKPERTLATHEEFPDIVDWMEEHFYVDRPRDPITAEILPPGPIQLAEYQKRILREALSRNDNGLLKYSTIVYSEPKKSGKTAIGAAVGMYAAYVNNAVNIYCLANDGKQSADRIYNAMARCIILHNKLGGIFQQYRANISRPILRMDNGSVIEAIPCDAAGEAGAEPFLSIWCYDDKTEILTKDGWKSYLTVTMDDEFATLNANGEFEWQHANAVNISKYNGNMLLGKSRRANMCVTPNHKVYCKTDKRVIWSKVLASDAAQCDRVCLRTRCDGYIADEITIDQPCFVLDGTVRKPKKFIPLDMFVEFMAWFLSKGCIQRKRGKPEGVDIAQSKKSPYRQDIIDLLEDMGYEPKEWKSGFSIVVYDVRLGNYCDQFGHAGDKFIPRWLKNLPEEYLELFLDTYIKGDGYWDSPNTYRISTKSKRMMNDIMEIGAKLGYGVRCIHKGKPGPDGVYVISLQHSGVMPSIYKRHWSVVPYNGMVWCPSTPNGIVLTRREGFVCWNGNSELWGFAQRHKERMWTEMTIPPTLFGLAMRWVESYAGYDGESKTLQQLYELGTTESYQHPDFPDLPVYVNEPARQLTFWSHEPRQPWQTQAYYDAEAKALTTGEFKRIHKNIWVSSSTSVFDDMMLWDRCKAPEICKLPEPGSIIPMVMALDAATVGDTCAIYVVSRHPDDTWDEEHRRVIKRYSIAFVPPKGKKIDYSLTMEPKIVWLIENYNIFSVVYDPYQLHKMCTDLRLRMETPFKEFSQHGRRLKADKQMYDMVIQRTFLHDGDATDREHVGAAAKSEQGQHMRFEKKASNKPIDLLVAASMAVDECLLLNMI